LSRTLRFTYAHCDVYGLKVTALATTIAPEPPPDQEEASQDLIPQGQTRWRPKGMTQLLDLQESCYQRAMKAKTSHEDFAGLARAFCLLEERIRIRRGIPLPGQLRPDLDREQIKRAMKRARARGSVIELMDDANGAAMLETEEPPEGNAVESKAPKPPTRKAPKPAKATDGETPKESL
jgi:hypothetical protein